MTVTCNVCQIQVTTSLKTQTLTHPNLIWCPAGSDQLEFWQILECSERRMQSFYTLPDCDRRRTDTLTIAKNALCSASCGKNTADWPADIHSKYLVNIFYRPLDVIDTGNCLQCLCHNSALQWRGRTEDLVPGRLSKNTLV